MAFDVRRRAALAFAPPTYLLPEAAGVELSTSGFKFAAISETAHGLVLSDHAEVRIASGVYTEGDVADHASLVNALKEITHGHHVRSAVFSLPEAKSYLFETSVVGRSMEEWRVDIEQRLEEFVPLPPPETSFAIVPVGHASTGDTLVAGVGYAKRIIDESLAVFDDAGVETIALEGEFFAVARALLPPGDRSTVMIVDLGRTTMKIGIVGSRIPRFSTTVNVGGHAFTLAVQKYFGVTEEEARKIKAERGLVSAPGNEDYTASMLLTASVLRDEIAKRLEYWQSKVSTTGAHEPISRILLVGGNASVRGFPEYLEGALRIPVMPGNVFTNFASRDVWLPPLDYRESLAYATAIGLALRNFSYVS